MKLIVGLGNPGRRYEKTRHNVGFMVLAELARRYATASPREQFQGETVEADLGGVRATLLAPHTLMNLSGTSVRLAVDFYKVELSDLLVVCDDFNLPVAKLRFRPQGSSGGQRGLEDIIAKLGTDATPRLRIGIGPVPDRWQAVDFVLSKFTKEEAAEMELAIVRAADAVVDWAAHGTASCMNQYN